MSELPVFRSTAMVMTLALAGCVTPPPVKPQLRPVIEVAPPEKSDGWKGIANAPDIDRVARLPMAWSTALRQARARGFGKAISEEGLLLEPNAAQPRPAPSPGSYSCRMIRIGSAQRKLPTFERFKPFFCYVEAEGDLLTIVKQTGSQRPAGRLWEDNDPNRLVFLGSLARDDGDALKAYGEDAQRDMAGVVERVAPFVWRLVIPWPRGNSRIELYELTPVVDQPQ